MSSEITRIVKHAAMQPVEEPESAEEFIDRSIEELYEDEPTKIQEVEIEVMKTALKQEEEDLPVVRSNTDQDGYYDPYIRRRHKSAEAEMQDRLLSIEGRPKNAPWGSLWLARSDFKEQIALINITKSEQRGLLRAWADIEVLAQGDGNEDIVESDQNEFMLKIISYKSRSDNPEKGTRERTAHITSKQIQDQTVTLPKNEQKSGFVNTLLGRNKQA